METQKQRPDGVSFLLIFYVCTTLFNLVMLLLSFPKTAQVDFTALGLLIVVLVLRGVGFVRLFLLKEDSWGYLALALLIKFMSDGLDFILGGSEFFFQRHSLVSSVVSLAINIWIIVYAYKVVRLESSITEKKQDSNDN